MSSIITEIGTGEPDLAEALRATIDRATGAVQPCPDCAGSGRDQKAFGYCPRCDGAGEIGKAIA